MSPMNRPTHTGTDRIAGAADTTRRDALKLLASGLAFSLAGCAPPREEIVPYVDMPERMVAGEPERYATALALAGFARGVIVDSIDGRPIKVSGNPRHPASLGSTDIFAEAEILSLYDPDRSGTVRGRDPVSTWGAFQDRLRERLDRLGETNGAGFRLVTGRVTSPTLKRQIANLMARYPEARWHAYEPAEGDLAHASSSLADRPALDEADVIVSLDADPLGPGPDQIANARRFAARRKPGTEGGLSRLYVIESTRTLTGANADHRLSLAPHRIDAFATALAARLGGSASQGDDLSNEERRLLEAIAAEAGRDRRLVVLAGDTLSGAAGKAVEAVSSNGDDNGPPPRGDGGTSATAPLDDLWAGLENDEITDLVMLGCNPVHDFPDPKIAEAIRRVAFSAHAGFHENETALACGWHLPLAHGLEDWSDLAARDGTVSIVQPLIRPLYDTRSTHEIVAMLAGEGVPDGYEIVRATWRDRRPDGDFEAWWRNALLAGIVENVPDALASSAPAADGSASRRADEIAESGKGGLVAVIRPDPGVYDGRFSNNAWLQECPRPIGKHAWSNVVALSTEDAGRLDVTDGDVVSVTSADGAIEGTAHVDPGQAAGVVGLTLGYGRTAGGRIGTGLGYNARALSPRRIAMRVPGVEVQPTGERRPVATTQDQFRLEGEFADLMPLVTAESDVAIGDERKKPGESFLHPERESDGYEWAMVIDNAACIGCNACVVACQSENNIPVVGPDEVSNSRIMHWLRIDRYEREEGPESVSGFEPVPCMQCQKAPCEPVCPVEASVHDTEGLNNQVYNRCVGTRFCQSNCPYKVRRFNWFAYGSGQEYENLGEQPAPARYNPDVTVRSRGVMEKCTYCVQRISRARHEAIKTDQPIEDGGVRTACQQACPTQAISFGNIADKTAKVTSLRDDPRHFTLLAELGTEPRTTYLARIRNASPDLEEDSS